MIFLTIVLVCASVVCCINFDVNNVKEIPLSGAVGKKSYFGYTILLQTGLKPRIIVGAPLSNGTGDVFSCDINGDCNKLMLRSSHVNSVSGTFLGSALDGAPNSGGTFVACAPRRATKGANEQYYLLGFCYLVRNSTVLTLTPLINERTIGSYLRSYYDNAFGQAGFDVHYIENSQTILLGAPGIKDWSGAFVEYFGTTGDYNILPIRTDPDFSDSYSYLGYAVTTGKLDHSLTYNYYIVGSPRGNRLNGEVRIYNGHRISRILKGDEYGSCFGAAVLAADVNNDRVDEIFVGAPMAAGSTFDEGYVHYYSSNYETKITGFGKIRARFGSSMVLLGDIDLDTYNDIAISAPYEDDGVGAVYIYRGSKQGIQSTYSQRLSPLNFNGGLANVRGFGQGMSRGNDVDRNGHNDLAVGAYQSGQVFMFRTKTVIDYRLALEANVTHITHNNPIKVKFCLYYTQRSNIQAPKSVVFKLRENFDYRFEGPKVFNDTRTVFLAETSCHEKIIIPQETMLDIQPFRISFNVEVVSEVMAVGETSMEKLIPYLHGCGDDNICQTQIELEVTLNRPSIILGLHKGVEVDIVAENKGEPGSLCRLYLDLPPELEYRDKQNCNFENETLVCHFATRLTSSQSAHLKFDLVCIAPSTKKITGALEVKCSGVNLTPNKKAFAISVEMQNYPYIEGKSVPENFYYDEKNLLEDLEIVHTFTVGNFGPSPVKLDMTILFPEVKHNDFRVFQFVGAAVIYNEQQLPCNIRDRTHVDNRTYIIDRNIHFPNESIIVGCFDETIECSEILCQGEYLYKSSETAKFYVNIKTNIDVLSTHYKKELTKKNIVALVSFAFLHNSTTSIGTHSTTLIISSSKKPVPLWIYIVGGFLGIILLLFIILLLYKCNFFERQYRDKLNDERLINKEETCMKDIPLEKTESQIS